MADAGLRLRRGALVALALAMFAGLPWPNRVAGQSVGNPPTPDDMVVDVRIVGNQGVSLQRIGAMISTRAGRLYDPDIIESDVRALTKSRLFVSVNTSYMRVPEGIVVIFQFVERPTVRYVRYVGASIRRSTLEKQSGIKVGDSIDPYLVEDARRKLEDYYKSKGFAKARILLSEGNKPGDRGVVFLIHEGPKQRVYEVEFEGNTFVDDGRLKTQISSKPPILYLFKGEFDEQKIDEDVEKLTAYYRSFGFFSARISREWEFGESGNWATLRFVIDEGPRYKVRNVTVVGAKRFPTAELEEKLKLKGGKEFEQAAMNVDVSALQDRYGEIGYVYCAVQPDPRFLETPGELDMVYKIEEGARYRVARVDVKIEGDDPHTRVNTVLNRVDLRPGDIADIRKIRDSERRLAASGLFQTNPAQGNPPKITYQPLEDEAVLAAQPGGNYRGQSPDDYVPAVAAPAEEPDRPLYLTFDGRLAPGHTTEEAVQFLSQPDPAAQQLPPPESWAAPAVPAYLLQPQYAPTQVEPTYAAPVRAEPAYVPAPAYLPEPAYTADAPIQPRAVRFQSPSSSWQPAQPPQSGFGQTGGDSWGQQPLGATAPGANVTRVGYAPTSNSPSAPVVQTQYTTPSYAPAATPVPNAYAAPGYVAQPGYATQPGYAAVAPGQPQPPMYPQPTPSPFMGNAPGVGAPQPGFAGAPNPAAPLNSPGAPGYGSGGEMIGSPQPVFPYEEPTRDLIIEPTVQEAQTGRFMLGVGVNSNAGLLGSIILDEQNADITRLPTSWRDFIEGRAFRGAGQQFRIEAVPGTQVSRYSFVFRQPYLFDTRVQFGLSGYYFQRYYRDWKEERLGGRVSLGYQFPYVPDLSVNTALRMESVELSQPTIPTPPQLQAALGTSSLYVWENMLVHDTRDNTFLATQGHRIAFGFDQAFGDYSFSRGTFEARQHFLLSERPDRSGRQVVTVMTQLGVTGTDTPIFENYFAGGFSSMRGFNFRGVGPYVGNVNVGGQFQWLNTVEYMFSVSADDMIRAVLFCDFGTVEDDVAVRPDNFRVAPGFGIRMTVPAMGPAPIALDFTVPVLHAPGDNIQNFAFYVGFGR